MSDTETPAVEALPLARPASSGSSGAPFFCSARSRAAVSVWAASQYVAEYRVSDRERAGRIIGLVFAVAVAAYADADTTIAQLGSTVSDLVVTPHRAGAE